MGAAGGGGVRLGLGGRGLKVWEWGGVGGVVVCSPWCPLRPPPQAFLARLDQLAGCRFDTSVLEDTPDSHCVEAMIGVWRKCRFEDHKIVAEPFEFDIQP